MMLFEHTDLSCHYQPKTHASLPEHNRMMRDSQTRIPSGCTKLSRPEIIDKVKGLIFGESRKALLEVVARLRWTKLKWIVTPH
jgi:hypothetical protein